MMAQIYHLVYLQQAIYCNELIYSGNEIVNGKRIKPRRGVYVNFYGCF